MSSENIYPTLCTELVQQRTRIRELQDKLARERAAHQESRAGFSKQADALARLGELYNERLAERDHHRKTLKILSDMDDADRRSNNLFHAALSSREPWLDEGEDNA